MPPNREAALAWEAKWSRPAGVVGLVGLALVVAAIVVATTSIGGGSDSELLIDVDQHRAAQMISSILQAIGVALLALPLYVLFRAATARSETMRGQLVGVIFAGPLFLAVLAILSGLANISAASDYVGQEVPRLMSEGVALNSDRANEVASDTITGLTLRGVATGFGFGGALGLAVGMLYTSLHSMRSGLLTRFWGSLGMALGAASLLSFQFALIWFLYLGLLLTGWVPGGRPPAWEAGEAMPWPTPGEKAARELQPGEDEPAEDEEPDEDEAGEGVGGGPASGGPGGRRKRKRRD